MALIQELAERTAGSYFLWIKNRLNHLDVKIDHLSKTAYIEKNYLL